MTQTVYASTEDVPLRVRAGVKNSWTLEFYNDDGTAKDMSGYTFYGQIRDRANGQNLADLVFDTSNLASGILPFSLSKANSALIGAGQGVYDILQEEDADDTNLVFLFGGGVEVIAVHTEVPA